MNSKSLSREKIKQRALAAIDLGAESCRVSLLRWIDGEPRIQVVHRFPNGARQSENGLRWDITKILAGTEEGLRRCAEIAPEGVASIGVDGWAVDYVRLDSAGEPIADPFCYRDERNVEAEKQVHQRISAGELYRLSGVQILSFNSLYQLFADGFANGIQSRPWINLPEFVLYRLGGDRVAEYTNATHSQLVAVADRKWCGEIFERAGLNLSAAPPLVQPGAQLGKLKGSLSSLPAFRETLLIAPACHDTASAIAGIPAQGDDWAFISSGTWSLVGAVLDAACASEAARTKNYSNLGGVGGKTYLVKNVNGMWLLQQCMEQWKTEGHVWKIGELIEACATLPAPENLLNVDEPNLLLPGNMPERINAQLRGAGKSTVGASAAPEMASLILHSLAHRYAEVLRDVQEITGKKLRRLCIVGGGSRNQVLNRLTAKTTGLEVVTGSTESTTVGNFAVQLASLAGNLDDGVGVSASAVADWAAQLSGAFSESKLEVQPAI